MHQLGGGVVALEDVRAVVASRAANLAQGGLEVLEQASGFELIDHDEDVAHVVHVGAAVVDLAGPFGDEVAQAAHVVLVVQLDGLLPDVGTVVAGDVEDGLDHLGQRAAGVEGQQVHPISVVEGDARVGGAEVEADLEGHGC